MPLLQQLHLLSDLLVLALAGRADTFQNQVCDARQRRNHYCYPMLSLDLTGDFRRRANSRRVADRRPPKLHYDQTHPWLVSLAVIMLDCTGRSSTFTFEK